MKPQATTPKPSEQPKGYDPRQWGNLMASQQNLSNSHHQLLASSSIQGFVNHQVHSQPAVYCNAAAINSQVTA